MSIRSFIRKVESAVPFGGCPKLARQYKILVYWHKFCRRIIRRGRPSPQPNRKKFCHPDSPSRLATLPRSATPPPRLAHFQFTTVPKIIHSMLGNIQKTSEHVQTQTKNVQNQFNIKVFPFYMKLPHCSNKQRFPRTHNHIRKKSADHSVYWMEIIRLNKNIYIYIYIY